MYLVNTPYTHPQQTNDEQVWLPTDQGPDDYIARYGRDAFKTLIDNASPADPVVRLREATSGLSKSEKAEAADRILREPFVAACLSEASATKFAAVAALGVGVQARALQNIVKEFKGRLAARVGKTEEEAEYEIKDGCIYKGPQKITNFKAEITNEVILDDSAERVRTYAISGTLFDGTVLPSAIVPAGEFHGMEWVAAHWGARVWMRQRWWGFVAEAVQLRSTPESVTKYTHFGWRKLDGKLAYLLPGGAITETGHIDLCVEVPQRLARFQLTPVVDAKVALEASLSILEMGPDHITVPAVLSVYLAPLVEFLGPTFVVWMNGGSGSHKSTFAALLTSHFGDFAFNTHPETWVSTANAMETTLWRAKDALLTIDNYVPPNSGNEARDSITKAKRLIQSYGDGTSRGRLDSSAEEKAPRPPRCMPLVTAEILPPENVSTLGRIFSIPVSRGELNMEMHDEIKAKKHLLREAMSSYLSFVARNPDLAKVAVPIRVRTLGPGPLGWSYLVSYDGGATTAQSGATSATVPLTGAGAGLTLNIAAGTASSDNVWVATCSALADQSGNGLHATQATATKQPVVSIGLNGFASLVFDGVDDGLVSLLNLPAPGTTPFSHFAVFRQTAWQANRYLISRTSGGYALFGQGTSPRVDSFNGSDLFNSGAPVGTFCILEVGRSNQSSDTVKVGSTTVTGTAGNLASTGMEFGFGFGGTNANNLELLASVFCTGAPNWPAIRAAVTQKYGASVLL